MSVYLNAAARKTEIIKTSLQHLQKHSLNKGKIVILLMSFISLIISSLLNSNFWTGGGVSEANYNNICTKTKAL